MAGKELELAANEVAAIMGDVAPEPEDPAQIQRMIVERIVSATSIDELFTQTGTIATQKMVGIPLILTDSRLMSGEIDGEDSVYMILEATREDTGELVVLNSGAPSIMAISYRAKKLGILPMQVEVAEAGKARGGRNAPLTLRPRGDTLKAITKAERGE
jgi:hypothetical protein